MSKVEVKYARIERPIEEVTVKLTEDEAFKLMALIGKVLAKDGLHPLYESLREELQHHRYRAYTGAYQSIKLEKVE